jgi:dTMP kinase
LYLAARSENIRIIQKYHKKKIILIDRFIDSTIAYQHYGMGVDIKVIKLINRFLLKNISVDFTFLNLVNKKNLYLRLKKRKNLNRYDKFNINFYNKVQNGFLKLANQKIKSYQIVNSNLDIKLNEKLILKKIEELIF